MVNSLGPTGLLVNSISDIITDLTVGMQAIYGPDINVDSNSPDGQLINLFAQAIADMLQLLQAVYGSFAVTGAFGTVLDQRVAINGIARKQGTFTQTSVLVTVSQALTLNGLDQTVNTPFTIQDNAGNQYALLTTYVFSGAGNALLVFQAVAIGQVEVTANTIVNQVTTILGVVSVNNPQTSINTAATTSSGFPQITGIASTTGMAPNMLVAGPGVPTGSFIVSVDSATQITISQNATASATVTIMVTTPSTITGANEETDAQLKIRQIQSFALASTGPADAVSAALLALPDVVDASVIENDTGSTVGGTAAHSIWCIVNGGTSAEIGQAIYAKKMPGCGMRGAQSYIVTRPNGNTFTALWDLALSQPLYIAFGILWRGQPTLTNTDIITQLSAALVYKLSQNPNIGDIVTAMQTIAPTAIVLFGSSQGVSSDNASWESVVDPTTAQYYYTVSAGNISIS